MLKANASKNNNPITLIVGNKYNLYVSLFVVVVLRVYTVIVSDDPYPFWWQRCKSNFTTALYSRVLGNGTQTIVQDELYRESGMEGHIRRVQVLTLVNTLNRLEPDPDKGPRAVGTPSGTAAFLSRDRVLLPQYSALAAAIAAMLGLKPGPEPVPRPGNTSFPCRDPY